MLNIDRTASLMLNLSIGQFRNLKRGVRLLTSCGMDSDNAIDVLVTGITRKREEERERKQESIRQTWGVR